MLQRLARGSGGGGGGLGSTIGGGKVSSLVSNLDDLKKKMANMGGYPPPVIGQGSLAGTHPGTIPFNYGDWNPAAGRPTAPPVAPPPGGNFSTDFGGSLDYGGGDPWQFPDWMSAPGGGGGGGGPLDFGGSLDYGGGDPWTAGDMFNVPTYPGGGGTDYDDALDEWNAMGDLPGNFDVQGPPPPVDDWWQYQMDRGY
jgi:hypothetical protein